MRHDWYTNEFQRLRQRAGLRRICLKGLRNTSVSLMLASGLTEVQAGRFVARGRIFCGEGQAVLQSSRDGGVGADFSVQALLDSADQLPGYSCALPDLALGEQRCESRLAQRGTDFLEVALHAVSHSTLAQLCRAPVQIRTLPMA